MRKSLYDDDEILRKVTANLLTFGNVAGEQFDRAQQLQPDHWKSLFNEVLVLAFDLGRIDEAARELERLRRLQPNNPDVQRLAAELGARRGAA